MNSKSTKRALGSSNGRHLAFEALESRRLLATYVVNTTADVGAGSLRDAIAAANSNPGADDIHFNIGGGGLQTITPLSSLPTVTDEVTIDGTTQPGFASSPLIEISGALAGGSGLTITASNSEVHGLIINRFAVRGVQVIGSDNIIAGNWIGLDATGNGAAGNGLGVFVSGARNTIGGTTVLDRNVMSASTVSIGLFISGAGATDNVVQGNYIGLNAAGTAAVGNRTDGIRVQNGTSIVAQVAGRNIIGGTDPGARNVISGNGSEGITIPFTSDCTVQGNYIGTDASGTVAAGITHLNNPFGNNIGIFLNQSSNNLVGGTDPGAGNLVSGNRNNGISVLGSVPLGVAATGNVVQGNFVGTQAGGTGVLGNRFNGINFSTLANNNIAGGTSVAARNISINNGSSGVNLFGSGNTVQGNWVGIDAAGNAAGNVVHGINVAGSNNLIGGSVAGAANRIAFNAGAGIQVATGTGNRISRNSIFSNGALGIDLLPPPGPNPNDPQDPDVGGNLLQNYPVITSVITTGSSTIIEGTLNSAPNEEFTIEFFRNLMGDPSGFGEGQTFIGDTTVMTDGDGNATFTVVFAGVPAGEAITATATDAGGNTSEFSGATTVEPAPPGSIFLIPDACHPGETALIVNGTPMDDNIHIAPSGGGVEVTMNGVSQGTYQPTGRIIVYGYAGNDSVQVAGSVPNEAWLYGDSGDDRLNLGNGGGIAFGGDGNDHLLGGSARDILVGGDGADRLVGNSGDDILIAAMSIYDDRFVSPVHEAAWCAIHHEWKRTDHTYEQRVDNIRDGSGTPLDRENGPYFLNSITVLDDGDEDKLTGAAARDWFFANLDGPGTRDIITDLKNDEVADELLV